MVVPAYYRSRHGRVFRIQRLREELADRGARYVLRAFRVRAPADAAPVAVAGRELSAAALRDKLRYRQAVPIPEHTFEQLWEQLRLDLEAL